MGALTQYYVNPAIAGNSGTGTLLDPFGDLQYALDTIVRDATNGDQVNIKAGTAEILAASLTLATYGTPAESAPLILAGYTSAAGDGGIGEIDCNGNTMWTSSSYIHIGHYYLKCHNFGNNSGINFSGVGSGTFLEHCEVYKGVSTPNGKYLIQALSVIGCYVHDAGTAGIGIDSMNGIAFGNYIKDCPTGSYRGAIIRNIIVDSTTYGINAGADNAKIIGNSIYSSTASTGKGIYAASGITPDIVMNNIIEGYSGAGGIGINITSDCRIYGYNAIYNCTTPETNGDIFINLGGGVTPASSPFTNPAGGDFSLNTAVVGAIDGAFPGTWYGPAATTDHADIGAVQNGAGAGGNVNHLRGKL